MKRRVLFLMYSLCGGGAERVLIDTVNRLDPAKYQITLCALFHDAARAALLAPQVEYRAVFSLCPGPLRKLVSGVVQYLLPPRWVYRWFFQGEYDVEVAFLEAFPTKILAYSTNPLAKKYAWVHIDVNAYRKQDRLFFSRAHQKRCYARFDGIYCVSAGVRDAFVQKFGLAEKTHVAYNLLDEAAILRQKDAPCPDLWRGPFLLVSIGSLIPRKGFERLLDCCARLRSEGFAFHLALLGTGPLEGRLHAQITQLGLADTVQLLGYRENPYPYLAAADLYVSASYAEGFSTVISEAVVLGVPIVTTDTAGMREILGASEYGLVTENSTAALYAGLRRMLAEPALLRHYRTKARERAAFFSVHTRLAEYERILDQ